MTSTISQTTKPADSTTPWAIADRYGVAYYMARSLANCIACTHGIITDGMLLAWKRNQGMVSAAEVGAGNRRARLRFLAFAREVEQWCRK